MGKYNLDSILNELKKSEASSEKKEFSSDFYKASLEKDMNELEIILRLLPNPDSDNDLPWVYRPAHMIKFANGSFMYEPCPKKAKVSECPICEEVNAMYESQNPKLEAIASKQYAKKRYFHNVLVVKDPRNNGENEGKVLIFEYGSQIHTMLKDILIDEQDPLLYFDPIAGANFRLKIVKKAEYPNYEKSKFMKPSPIEVDGVVLDEDEADEFISKNCHKLNEKLKDGEKVYKSYDDIKELYENQGVKTTKAKAKAKVSENASDDDDDDDVREIIAKAAAKKPIKKVVEDEDEDEAPVAKKKVVDAPVKKKVVVEDEDEDEAPVAKKKAVDAPVKKKAVVEDEDEDYTADSDSDDDAELRALLDD